ncbi:PTAC2 [Symbiodinium natans]|uniref:PTAC2 protein n=1 Tax=Symbiodinium natans TaxID=878477 RepID=A0A812JFJ9_9DINO|nr:PTAC2 [Symbiodinium natans]
MPEVAGRTSLVQVDAIHACRTSPSGGAFVLADHVNGRARASARAGAWRCQRHAARRPHSPNKRFRKSDPQQRALMSEMLREETEGGILQAVQRLRERDCLSSAHDYTSVVIAFSRKNYWQRACDVLSEMHARSLAAKPVAYNNAMNACLSRENWQQTLELLRQMRGREVLGDLFSYTNALTASSRAGLWQDSLRLIWDMVGDKVAPDIVAFNAALAACEVAGRWQWSLQLMKALGQAKLQPDDVTYRSITRALEAAEQQLRALRLEMPGRFWGPSPDPTLGSEEGLATSGQPLHYCIVQCDEQGLEGWSLAAGSKHRRWDTLLLGLLQCFMMDGQWLRNVAASVFVGPDALHATGALQPLVMTALGQGKDGRPFYQPATLKAFEESLWRQRGQDAEGLRWQLAQRRPRNQAQAKGMLLESLGELFDHAPEKAGVLAFDAGATRTYNELLASSWAAGREKLFVLLGGAHGFDGMDDADGRFFAEVLRLCEDRVGASNVAKVTLAEDASAAVFPLSKVISFISVEHCRGVFAGERKALADGAARGGYEGCLATLWLMRSLCSCSVPGHLPEPAPRGLRELRRTSDFDPQSHALPRPLAMATAVASFGQPFACHCSAKSPQKQGDLSDDSVSCPAKAGEDDDAVRRLLNTIEGDELEV